MSWHTAMLARLRANVGVQAVLGVDDNGKRKAYWEDAPQGTARPYVTLFDPSEVRDQNLKGWNLRFARAQIDVWADTKEEAVDILEACVDALVPGGTFGGVTFQRAGVELVRSIGGQRDGTKAVRHRAADLTFFYT